MLFKHSHPYFFIAMVVSSTLLVRPIQCQVILYDNLDNVRSDGHWHTANGPDRRYAQQIVTGATTNIDQVTIKLQRPEASATGSLRFELWRDNGQGKPVQIDDPTGKIVDLGTILDVTEIPIETFGEFTFDNLVVGLEPNHEVDPNYWTTGERSLDRGSSSL